MPGIDNLNQTLPDRVRQLERRVDQMSKGASLRFASITEGGLRVGEEGWIRSMNWDGTSVADPGEEGWAFGGPDGAAILNTLLLRDGIIGNEKLTSPVGWCWAQYTETNFAVATTGELRAQVALPVQEGFTKVAAMVIASCGATNTRASTDFLYIEPMLDTSFASELPVTAPAGNFATVTSARAGAITTLSGAAGQSIPIAVRVHSQGGAWAASAQNRAHVAVLGIAFR